MVKQAVVIGCRDAARAAALARAVAASCPVAVIDAWPLERAIAAGREPDTAVVVLDGFLSAAVLRVMADVTGAHPELAVLVLGPLEPDIEVLVALASGAFGYLPAGSTPAAVAEAVNTLLAGHAVLPRAVSVPLVQHLRWGGRGIVVKGLDGRAAELTNREWEVLVLLRQACTTAEIARRLVVSKGTVRTHVAALVHKLGAHDRGALAVAASARRGGGSPSLRGPGTPGGHSVVV
jgi:DNA-binding NarL/FixJ family response regulator